MATAPAATAKRPPSAAPWPLAVSSALTTALMSVVGATAPDLRAFLGVTTGALTLAFIGQMLGALGGSWRSGGRGTGARVSPLALVAVAALTAAAFAPSLTLLVAAMLVAGVGGMAANASAQAETMRRAGPRRAQALSQFHVFGGTGAAVFPLTVAPLLAAGLHWRAAFVLVVAGWLAYAWINRDLRVLPSPREPGAPPPRVTARGRWAVAVAVVGGGLQLTFPLYLASLVVDRFGVSAATGSATIGVYSIGVLLARAGGTALLPRLPVDRQLRLSAGVLLIGLRGPRRGGQRPRRRSPPRCCSGSAWARCCRSAWRAARARSATTATPPALRVHLQLRDAAGHARRRGAAAARHRPVHGAVLTAPLAVVIALAVWRSRPEAPGSARRRSRRERAPRALAGGAARAGRDSADLQARARAALLVADLGTAGVRAWKWTSGSRYSSSRGHG